VVWGAQDEEREEDKAEEVQVSKKSKTNKNTLAN
jgi:hypothetical protein